MSHVDITLLTVNKTLFQLRCFRDKEAVLVKSYGRTSELELTAWIANEIIELRKKTPDEFLVCPTIKCMITLPDKLLRPLDSFDVTISIVIKNEIPRLKTLVATNGLGTSVTIVEKLSTEPLTRAAEILDAITEFRKRHKNPSITIGSEIQKIVHIPDELIARGEHVTQENR